MAMDAVFLIFKLLICFFFSSRILWVTVKMIINSSGIQNIRPLESLKLTGLTVNVSEETRWFSGKKTNPTLKWFCGAAQTCALKSNLFSLKLMSKNHGFVIFLQVFRFSSPGNSTNTRPTSSVGTETPDFGGGLPKSDTGVNSDWTGSSPLAKQRSQHLQSSAGWVLTRVAAGLLEFWRENLWIFEMLQMWRKRKVGLSRKNSCSTKQNKNLDFHNIKIIVCKLPCFCYSWEKSLFARLCNSMHR